MDKTQIRKRAKLYPFDFSSDIAKRYIEIGYEGGAVEQNEIVVKRALDAFCRVCGCKECAKRNVTCDEYKEFAKLIETE